MSLFDAIGSVIAAGQTASAIKKETAAKTAATNAATAQLTDANQKANYAVGQAGDAARSAVAPYATTGGGALAQLAGLYNLPVAASAPSGGSSTTPSIGGDPYAAYLAANPDIAAEEQRVVSLGQPLPNGAPATEANYLAWHDQNYANEGRNSYTGTGATTTPTVTAAASPTATTPNDPFATFYQSPDYQFKLAQGIGGVDAGSAARGMLDSGATRKAEINYAGNLAAGQYDTYTNKLLQLAGMGQNAANTTANVDTNQGATTANLATGLGANLSNLTTNQGNTVASSYLGQAANNATLIGSLTGQANQAANALTSSFNPLSYFTGGFGGSGTNGGINIGTNYF